MKITIEFTCSKCGKRIAKTYELGGLGYKRDMIRCSCGMVYRIRLEASLVGFDTGNIEQLLRDYTRWLREKKGLNSAYEYARIVERRLKDPDYFPRTISPLDYFIEYIEETRGRQQAEQLRRLLY